MTENHNQLTRDIATAWGIDPRGVISFASTFVASDNSQVPYAKVVEFLMICREHGLNPATKEIYGFFKSGQLTTGVAIDGWVKIMNQHPDFDGMESEYCFRKNQNGDDTEVPEWCEVTIYRKNRSRPTKIKLFYSEWNVASSPVWRQKPAWQLYVKTLKHCARIAFSFAGIVAAERDEMAADFNMVDKPAAVSEETFTMNDESTKPADIVEQLQESNSIQDDELAKVSVVSETANRAVEEPKELGSPFPTESESEPESNDQQSSMIDNEPEPIDEPECLEIVELTPTNDQASSFGSWIKERRKELGITLSKAAMKLDTTAKLLKVLEAGNGEQMQMQPDSFIRSIYDLYGEENVDAFKQIKAWFRRP